MEPVNDEIQPVNDEIQPVNDEIRPVNDEIHPPFDLSAASQRRITQNYVDASDEDEAPLPGTFIYKENDSDLQIKQGFLRHTDLTYSTVQADLTPHYSQPWPRVQPIELPSDIEELPPLQYDPMNLEQNPVRLFLLLPHGGEDDSIVQGHMFHASLDTDHFCYIGIRHTRGHPRHLTTMIINGKRKIVTRNVYAFLRTFRTDKKALLLYIREICVDRESQNERDMFLNETRESLIFTKSCRMLDMDDFMELEAEQEAARLAPDFSRPEKKWLHDDLKPYSIESEEFPHHFPIRLGAITTPPSPYRYLPLDICAGEFRLLALKGAKDFDDPIEAHLAHEPLNSTVRYNCLSYTWGSMETDCEILLNGQIFRITRNLDAALRHFRSQFGEGIVLWIDAICINQSDRREKSRQIPRMNAIYEHADSVMVWIGPADDTSELAMTYMQQLHNDEPEVMTVMPDRNYEAVYSPRNQEAFRALCRLLSRPYFSRTWIVQEIAMSSNPQFYCGARHVTWWALMGAVIFINRQLNSGALRVGDTVSPLTHGIPVQAIRSKLRPIHILRYQRKLQESAKPARLLHLALMIQVFDSTNPRDKIYGLWDLASDTRALGLVPDYGASLTDVYVDFVKRCILHHRSLDIICAVQPRPMSLFLFDNDNEGRDLPSWCPDWRQKSYLATLIRKPMLLSDLSAFEGTPDLDQPVYHAAGQSLPSVIFDGDDRAITASGICIGTISHVTKIEFQFTSTLFAKWLRTAREHLLPSQHSANQEVNPQYTGHATPRYPAADFDTHFWSLLLGESRPTVFCEIRADGAMRVARCPEDLRITFFEQTEHMIAGRTLAFTDTGYMALLSWVMGAGVGMQVVVLKGCSVPVVLEEAEGESEEWVCRGSVFVQGAMEGEAVVESDDGGWVGERKFRIR